MGRGVRCAQKMDKRKRVGSKILCSIKQLLFNVEKRVLFMSSKKKNNKPKHHRQKSFSPRHAVMQAKVELSKSKDPESVFNQVRSAIPLGEINDLADWMMQSDKFSSRVFGNPFPRSSREWNVSMIPQPASYMQEFRWACVMLKRYANQLSEFVVKANQFTQSFLLADYADCTSILDDIEVKFGSSIWLIKRRISLLHSAHGLEAQKKFAQSVKDDTGFQFQLIKFLTHYISYRSETTVSPARFMHDLKQTLDGMNLSAGFRAYINFHVLVELPRDIRMLAEIIRHEFGSSVIDRYETFLSVIYHTLLECDKSHYNWVRRLCLDLDTGIDDPRLHGLLNSFPDEYVFTDTISQENINLFQFIVNGNDKAAFDAGLKILQKDPTDLGAIYLTALCGDPEKLKSSELKSSKIPVYLPALISLFSSETISDEWVSLIRLVWILENAPISYFLTDLISREFSPDPILTKSYLPFKFAAWSWKSHPAALLWLDSISDRTTYLDEISSINPEVAVQASYLIHGVSDKNICINGYVGIRNALSEGNLKASLTEAGKLTNNPHKFFARYAIKARTYCLLHLGEHEECIKEVVRNHILHNENIGIFPIREIYEEIDDVCRETLNSSLEYVIFCSLYVDEEATQQQYIRNDSAEDFLSAHGVSMPSCITTLAGNFDKDLLVYFLSKVCKESTYDTWMNFDCSKDVAKERVEICRAIIQLEPAMKDECQAEIRDIMQRLKIKERLREIDQSKIYVDVESVKKAARKNLGDSFARYLSFVESGMTHEDIEIRKMTASFIAEKNIDALVSLEYPQHEMSSLLGNMVVLLRDEFVSSNQHGLDGYLSVRIRHNTLAGQLWSPFDNEHLHLTKGSSGNGEAHDGYWSNRLGMPADSYDFHLFTQALSIFNDAYEELIGEIKSTWIKVAKTKEDPGFINFMLTKPEIGYLSLQVKPNMEFDTFLDSVIDYFFHAKLEPSLERVRSSLQTEAKSRINKLLDELSVSCEAISLDTSALRAAIGHARTNSQTTIDRLTEWFRVAVIEKREPFSIEEAVSITDASIKTACSEFKSNYRHMTPEMADYKMQANLTSFVDLLFIAFDNVVRWSDMGVPSADVCVGFVDNSVVVKIESPVSKTVNSTENISRVKSIYEKVQLDPFSQSVTKEGGSGFYKMQKILHHDFALENIDRKPSLSFEFTDNDTFLVTFKIPISEVRCLEEN
jgi:hypothetical protein